VTPEVGEGDNGEAHEPFNIPLASASTASFEGLSHPRRYGSCHGQVRVCLCTAPEGLVWFTIEEGSWLLASESLRDVSSYGDLFHELEYSRMGRRGVWMRRLSVERILDILGALKSQ
jgi:hypothetical protein